MKKNQSWGDMTQKRSIRKRASQNEGETESTTEEGKPAGLKRGSAKKEKGVVDQKLESGS